MTIPALEMLDGELAEDGQDIVLQRVTGGTAVAQSVTVRAFVRRYAPEFIGVNGITDQTSEVILSPTQIISSGWTSGRASPEDGRIPMQGNRAIINGRPRIIEAADGIFDGPELVRIEMKVRG